MDQWIFSPSGSCSEAHDEVMKCVTHVDLSKLSLIDGKLKGRGKKIERQKVEWKN